jgi:hypothetical protein
VSEPNSEIKQRDRQIAENESVRQATGDIRVTSWAIGIAVVIGFVSFGWLLLGR